jgi:hypothetical protein
MVEAPAPLRDDLMLNANTISGYPGREDMTAKWIWPVAAACTFALVGAEGDGCSTEISDEPDSGDKRETGKKAKLGDAITLTGQETEVRVTVLDVIDPVEAGEFDEPESGNKYVGVRVQIENVGDGPYQDSPGNGATLITNKDEEGQQSILTAGICKSGFDSDIRVSPGSKRRGCIPFEIPETQDPKTFQFGPDSGFGEETGEWSLR